MRAGRLLPFKIEQPELWRPALDHIDRVYELVQQLPPSDDDNVSSPMHVHGFSRFQHSVIQPAQVQRTNDRCIAPSCRLRCNAPTTPGTCPAMKSWGSESDWANESSETSG